MNVEKNIDHREKFTKYMNDIYGSDIIPDYEHHIKRHDDNIYEINQVINTATALICNPSHCQLTARHYSQRGAKNENHEKIHDPRQEMEGKLLFYCDLFDVVALNGVLCMADNGCKSWMGLGIGSVLV